MAGNVAYATDGCSRFPHGGGNGRILSNRFLLKKRWFAFPSPANGPSEPMIYHP